MSVSTTSTDDADGASRATPVAAQAAADASSLEAVHTTHTANKRARLSRRALLAGGSGLVVVGGTAAGAIKYLHLYSRLRLKILHHFGIDDLPASHPHALPDGPMTTPRDIVIFDGTLAKGWQDWSWASHVVGDGEMLHDAQRTISLHLANWGGLQLHGDTFDTLGFGYIQCWVRAAGGDKQAAHIALIGEGGNWTDSALLGDYTQGGAITRDGWRLSRVPLADLHAEAQRAVGVVVQAAVTQSQGTLYLADLRIVYHPDLRPPKLLRAWTYDLQTVTLAFDQPMDAASVSHAAVYLVAAAAGTTDTAYPAAHPVAPMVARYHEEGRTVSLTLATALRPSGTYAISLASVKDRLGVATPPGLQSHVQVTNQPLTVTLDVAGQRRTISPDIYGLTGVGADVAADLGVKVLRWGGNPTTRYNWKLGNAFNAARDYHFINGNYGATSPADRKPSGVADQAIAASRARNIQTLLTIPTIGWVARNDDGNTASQHVPDRGGPPLRANGDAVAGYDPTANRRLTSVPSRARKGAPFSDPPDLSDPTVAQDEWVYHLVRRFGRADAGGVRYYAMDNEPDLWWATHTDIRPAQLSYDQMRDIFLDYASAVKDVDPSALIIGPVSWGWPNYFYSPLDYATDNYRTHADRDAHGGTPFLEWWLSEIRKHDETAGRRTLDVLDLHFYPQGGEYSNDTAPAMAALRLRSTRGLWDPNYSDESWIGQPVRLIPRMREWITAHYPGTKIGLSEWTWGAEGSMNGAIALAEVLGIFGREGLDMACHWGGLDPSWPAYAAFKLFGNYDGQGSNFTGTSFAAHSTHEDMLSCYATQTDGNLLVIVLNKSVDNDLTPTMQLKNAGAYLGGAALRRMRAWRVWPDETQSMAGGRRISITPGPDVILSDDVGSGTGSALFSYTFPASSITLLRLETNS
ncbi:MAG: glycoside hydrolase family 44 protein [Ktedonobacterales bacterium]